MFRVQTSVQHHLAEKKSRQTLAEQYIHGDINKRTRPVVWRRCGRRPRGRTRGHHASGREGDSRLETGGGDIDVAAALGRTLQEGELGDTPRWRISGSSSSTSCRVGWDERVAAACEGVVGNEQRAASSLP